MGFRWFLTVGALAVLLPGCSGVIDPSKNQVDNFSGVVTVGGVFTKVYSWDKNGEVEVAMTSVTPTPTNGPLAMYIGQPDGSEIAFKPYDLTQAIVNRTVQFGVLNKGSWCLASTIPGRWPYQSMSRAFSHP
jgi:hypothetical protein